MKSKRALIALAGCAVLLLTVAGCENEHRTDIPVDKERAKAHVIPIRVADAYIKSFAIGKDSLGQLIKDSTFLDKQFNMPVAEMFNRDAIALLLNQKGADGIRIYLGRDSIGQVRLVLLAVDSSGKDIRRNLLNTDDKKDETTDPRVMKQGGDGFGEAVEVGQRCPTICD